MNIRELVKSATAQISERDAEVLVTHVLGVDRAWIRAHGDDEPDPAALVNFQDLVQRRAGGEPLQYITAKQEFYGIPLHVAPGVLIPRPETELLVEAVLGWIAAASLEHPNIADVGTGSGAIAIAFAKELPEASIIAIDISTAALAIARRNVSEHEFAANIELRQADLLQDFAFGSVDIIVSNPPYVPAVDAGTMQREVVEHEPHSALFAGNDGLDVYRRLVPQAAKTLRPNGLLAMELGWGQRDALTQLLSDWANVRFIHDYAGIPRVVLAEPASQ